MPIPTPVSHSLAWSLNLGFIPVSELTRLPWCHSDDYGGAVFEGVGAWWCPSHGAWNARALWYQIKRFCRSVKVVLKIDLWPVRQQIFEDWCHLFAVNGVPGQNTYSRPRAWNNNPKRGVGELVELAAEMFTQYMSVYLVPPAGDFGATLWLDQYLQRLHPWSVIKWEGNYGEPATRKSLCHPDQPNRVPAHEVLMLSKHQPLDAQTNWEAAVWTETSGSCVVLSDGEALETSHSRHLALDSISLQIIELICERKRIPLRRGDPTVGRLRRAKGVALVGSWTEMTMVQHLLVGFDSRIELMDDQRDNPPCQIVGHAPREYECDCNNRPDELLLDVQREYQRFLRGESTLGLPEHLTVLIEPKVRP